MAAVPRILLGGFLILFVYTLIRAPASKVAALLAIILSLQVAAAGGFSFLASFEPGLAPTAKYIAGSVIVIGLAGIAWGVVGFRRNQAKKP